MLLLAVLCILLTTVNAVGCDTFSLDQCIDSSNRPDIPCGRGLCPDKRTCLWCIYDPSSPSGECISMDPCAPLNASVPSQCFGGYIESKNTYDCDSIHTAADVGLAFASLIPSIAYFFLIHYITSKHDPFRYHLNFWISVLAMSAMYVLLVCVATIYRDYRLWGFLWMPCLVFPLGLYVFYVSFAYCIRERVDV
jgi:hypothetical protein